MKKVYFNNPQRLTQLIGANTTVIVAGRRTGKTDSIASPFVLRNMQRMPTFPSSRPCYLRSLPLRVTFIAIALTR